MLHKKIAIAAAVAVALGAGSSFASQQMGYATFTPAGAVSNFTMLTPSSPASPGYAFGGTNDVTFTWDGSIFNASSDYTGVGSVSNATISSPTKFFSFKWSAHDVQVFGPGTYTFNTVTGLPGDAAETGNMTMTVGPGQLGAHMLFNWNSNNNIDVVNVWNVNQTFSSCATPTAVGAAGANCLWSGVTNTVGNSASTVFSLVSTDADNDGTKGVPMAAGGPFAKYNANFNVQGTIVFAGPPPAPVASNDTFNLSGSSGIISVLANDSTGGGSALDPATVTISTPAVHGTAAANADGTVTYTPDGTFAAAGSDTFQYTVKNTDSPTPQTSNAATVTVQGAVVSGPVPPIETQLGGGGGCSVSENGNGPLARADLGLLGLFIGWLGLMKWARRTVR